MDREWRATVHRVTKYRHDWAHTTGFYSYREILRYNSYFIKWVNWVSIEKYKSPKVSPLINKQRLEPDINSKYKTLLYYNTMLLYYSQLSSKYSNIKVSLEQSEQTFSVKSQLVNTSDFASHDLFVTSKVDQNSI